MVFPRPVFWGGDWGVGTLMKILCIIENIVFLEFSVGWGGGLRRGIFEEAARVTNFIFQ